MNDIPQTIDYYNDFIQHIPGGELVPIISNGFRLDEIFETDAELRKSLQQKPEFYDEVRSIDQQLTKQWAREKVQYPMSDDHNLARVAQYYQVMLGLEQDGAQKAKNDYLRFINERLLKNFQDKKEYQDLVADFKKNTQTLKFSKLADELDVPLYADEKKDPLRLFAKLPLTTYITTSYFTFIERALKKEGKQPITQYWSWGRVPKLEYLSDPDCDPPIPLVPPRDCIPSSMRPVVYHLFGIEDVAKTLMISEDDFLNFLMNTAENKSNNDLFPSSLRDAIGGKRLLLMGYNLRDWDFRTLFRFISKLRGTEYGLPPSIAIQLKPTLENKEIEDVEEKSLDYLEKYFKDYKFNVKWIDKKQFVYELYDAWKKSGAQ